MTARDLDVVQGVERLERRHGPLFVVIGVFDGLHLGHRYLLEHLVEAARRHAARPAVITFDSHPDEVLVGAAPPLLLDPAERVRLLGEAGVEVVVVQHFDAALRQTEYDAFVGRVAARAGLAGILMTPDAAFGHERRGTPEALATLGAREGFDVVVVPPFTIGGHSVRSSDVRAAIGSGQLRLAEELLGRPYCIAGRVDADRLTTPMPVAQPPAGTWPVSVGTAGPGTGTGERATLSIAGDGTMRLDPVPAVPEVRAEFARTA